MGARCDKTGRIYARMKARFVMTVNNCEWTNGTGPLPGDSSRIGNTCGTPVRIFARIGGTSVPIVRIVGRTDVRAERSDVRCAAIGKTCEPTIVGFGAGLSIRVGTIGRQGQDVSHS